MESIDKIKRLADIVAKNTAPGSNTNTLIGNLLKAMVLYMAEQHHGAVGGYQFLNSIEDLPTGDLTDKQKRTGYVVGENIYFYVGTDGDTLDGEYQNGGSFHGTKGDDGLSAYEIWKAIDPNNANKTEGEFLASLKQSGIGYDYAPTQSAATTDNTIYAIPDEEDENYWYEYYRKNGTLYFLGKHQGGLGSILGDLESLKQRDEPIVFTESKEMNAFIKHLFVDVSDYNGSEDVSNLYAYFFNNGNGTIYLSIYNAVTGGTLLISYLDIAQGKGVYCSRLSNGIYFYLEVNENAFPTSSISRRAKLTSWCFSPSCDPRLNNVGVTENPNINKYLSALYVDITNYTGEFAELKNDLRLYALINSVNATKQYMLSFRIGAQTYTVYNSNTKPDAIVEKSFSITGKGEMRIVAKVNWEAFLGVYIGSQYLKLNPCVFEKEFFYAQIEPGEEITLEGLKSQFSTRVFTKSASHNQIIKKLFIDITGYTGSVDLSEGVYFSLFAKNISNAWGPQLKAVKDNSSVGNFFINSQSNVQETVFRGIYLYAEYDWDAFPDNSRQFGVAELTNEAFSPINDPRKSVGLSNLKDEVTELLNGGSGDSGNGVLTPLTGGVYGCVGDSITEGAGVSTNLSNSDPYLPQNNNPTTSKATYGYLIAKSNRMSWYNYGISGSTLGDVMFNGTSRNGFAKANGRYTQLADGLTHISIFFGWNDLGYGHVMKREEWLLTEYGTKIYYPTESSLIGTTHTDGTPYATQSQYDACNSQTGTVNGVSYNNSSNYWRALYIGTPNDSTPYTFWGAWNTVLPYLINKYPLAKILLIVPYLSVTTEIGKLMQNTVRLAAHKFGLCYFDFNKSDSQLFGRYGWMDETTPDGQVNGMAMRNFRGADGGALFNSGDNVHPNENGYKYMYPSINAKLCSI